MISKATIDKIFSTIRVEEIIGEYVQLKRAGSNFKGLSPFHDEKTASFVVSPSKQIWKDFSSGKGGTAISFLMEIENFTYPEALRHAAKKYGIEIEEDTRELTEDEKQSQTDKELLFKIHEIANNFFQEQLFETEEGKTIGYSYFKERALRDEIIKKFHLGYSPEKKNAFTEYALDKGYSKEILEKSGLSIFPENSPNGVDRFRERVIFPIHSFSGRVLGFGARILKNNVKTAKYLNSPETEIYHKSNVLYGLNQSKQSISKNNLCLLVEGYMDVIAVNQAGFTNAVATLGTALTGEQAVLMKRYADEVIICYDADEAGQKATARAIPILRNSGLNVKVLTIPSGKDPDEFIKSKGNDGPAAFKALLDKCGNDVEYRLQKLKNAHNIQLTEGKVAFLEEAAKLIATISSPIERDVYSSKVASELGVDKNAFKQQVSRVSRRGERAEEKKQARQIQLELSRRNDKINPEHFQKPRSSSAEEALLVYLLNNPDAYEEISARVKPEQFQNTLMRRFFEYFSARIERGEDPLTNTAADFTQDENSKLYQLMSQAIPGASTAEAMNEYINVINEESSKLNSGDLADVSNEELMAYLDKIRKKKQ